jgi:hypothetical protein
MNDKIKALNERALAYFRGKNLNEITAFEGMIGSAGPAQLAPDTTSAFDLQQPRGISLRQVAPSTDVANSAIIRFAIPPRVADKVIESDTAASIIFALYTNEAVAALSRAVGPLVNREITVFRPGRIDEIFKNIGDDTLELRFVCLKREE